MYKPYPSKVKAFSGLLICILISALDAVGQNAGQKKVSNAVAPINSIKWKTDPLNTQVFIKNNGQFDNDIQDGKKVIYQARLGDANAYFTSNGVIYRYDEYTKLTARNHGKPVIHYLPVEWENTNPNVTIEAEQEQSQYYMYANGNNDAIKASGYKKIMYRNIYPGIDVEYTFPKDKSGIKYDIIIHPGADLSNVKLNYKGAKNATIDKDGNVVVNTDMGEFTDHSPVSFYKNKGNVNVSYALSGNEESFVFNGPYNKTETVIIDPWTTNPVFTASYDKAYDIGYDNNGNVYAYGGYNPFQLVKLSSAGAIQWTYNASTIDGLIYGDFAVDRTTGTSYIVEGAHAGGARILKVNTLGKLTNTFSGDTNMIEMWRVVMNPCTHKLIIGAGDNNHISQACTIDTSFTKLTYVNVLGASAAGHTMVFTALDPSDDTCYMATAKSAAIDTAKFKNVLVKMPLPSLSPASYIVPDSYKFVELASVNYVGSGVGAANGMNGIAVSQNWVYLSDGATLEKVNKYTGSIAGSIPISGTSFAWGGLDVNICDYTYVGNQSSISIYDPSFSLVGAISLSGFVYDVVLGSYQKIIYAGGNGFVTAITASSSIVASKISTPAECGCNGTAKVTLSACSSIDTTGLSYLWSNGETTHTATGLCAGQYSVSIMQGCTVLYTDTVVVSNHFISVNKSTPSICAGSGSGVSITASGGSSYTWRPSTGLNSTNTATVTATPTVTTTYTVAGTNGTGCKDSVIVVVTVVPVPNVIVSGPAIPVCPNTPVNLSASGATSYQWTPTAGLSCTTCSNTTANINFSGLVTFSVIGTTSGCSDTAKISFQVYAVPVVKVTTIPTSCDSFNGKAIGSVTGSEPYTYSWSPKGGTGISASGLAAGTYTLTVTDTNGCKTSATGAVSVTPSPTVTASSSGATCDSTNGLAIAKVVGGTAPYQYKWSPGGNTNSTDNSEGAGIYTVTVIDKNGCKDSAFTILEDTSLVTSFSARNNVSCFGGNNGGATVTVTKGGTGPFNYLWSPLGGNTSSVNNLTVGQFTVTVTDANHCKVIDTINISQPKQLLAAIGLANILPVSCFGGSNGAMSVSAGGGILPYSYSWSTAPVQTNDTAFGLSAGVYSVTVKDANSCTITVSDTVKQPSKIVTLANNSSATCGNNGSVTAIVTGGTPAYTYNWAGGIGNSATVYGLDTGTYKVIVTDLHGCKDSASTTIDTIGQTVTIHSSTNVLCFGTNTGTATAWVIGLDSALYNYAWVPSGGNTPTSVNLPVGSDTIWVTYLGNGCKKYAVVNITQPPLLNSIIKDTLKCGNIVLAYDSSWGGVQPYTYVWSPSGGSISSAALSSGSYTLTVSDANKCTNIVPFIAPFTNPNAGFIATPDTVIPGDSVKFTNLSTGVINWYWWTFGDGGNSSDTNPYHVYNYGGNYVVVLRVGSNSGCIDSVYGNIYVKEGVSAANVFTPNGDGINDVFHVNAYGLINYKIDIYDRWGLLMFEGVGPDNDWTGRTMAGEPASEGTYYYVITASDSKGHAFNTKGFVTLIK